VFRFGSPRTTAPAGNRDHYRKVTTGVLAVQPSSKSITLDDPTRVIGKLT
jgi:hypothetical protein